MERTVQSGCEVGDHAGGGVDGELMVIGEHHAAWGGEHGSVRLHWLSKPVEADGRSAVEIAR